MALTISSLSSASKRRFFGNEVVIVPALQGVPVGRASPALPDVAGAGDFEHSSLPLANVGIIAA